MTLDSDRWLTHFFIFWSNLNQYVIMFKEVWIVDNWNFYQKKKNKSLNYMSTLMIPKQAGRSLI